MTTETSPTANPRRFAVKPDAFFVRRDDGVWLRNNTGSFAIKGAGAYELVESLFTNLDGERTVDDLCSGLPQGARQSVARLVETLAGNGFLKESTHPAEHVPEWVRERYPAHLAYLEQHADRPVSRFTRVRTQLVACAGSGAALRALLGALAEFGIARVLVLTPDEGVADAVAEAEAQDPQFRWELRITDDLAGAEDAAHVLLASDDDDVDAVAGAQQALRAGGASVGVLGRCGDFVVATAPTSADEWCWECLHRAVAAPVTGDATGLGPGPTQLALAVLHLVQHVFTALAGVDTGGGQPVTSVEPLAPVMRMHAGRRHPRCGRHATRPPVTAVDRAALRGEPVRLDIPGSQDPTALVEVSDRIVVASTAWTDHVVGPLLALDEGATSQLPVSASTCRVAAPGSTASARETLVFTCHAISPREARNQVVLHALEWLARTAVRDRVVVGAGWTTAEAWYRAALAASAALEPESLTWLPVSRRPFTAHPVRDFLADALAADGRAWVATALEHLPTGFVRARVRTADFEVAGGLGIDEDHAVRNALLQAVTADLPGEGRTATAHLAPPVDTWLDAVAAVKGPQDMADVSVELGFPGACVLATPLGGQR